MTDPPAGSARSGTSGTGTKKSLLLSPMANIQPVSGHTANRFLRIIAEIISYVFHPVFMPVVMTLCLIYLNPTAFAGLDGKTRLQWVAVLGLNTIIYPLLSVALMKALGFVTSFKLKTMKDRIIPLIAIMIFYFWSYRVFKNFQAPLAMLVLLLGNFWGIILVFLCNIFTKISMHTAAAGGMIGLLIVLMFVGHVNLLLPLLLALLIAGLIGTARMILREHRPLEIWLGYAAGILAQLGAFLYLH